MLYRLLFYQNVPVSQKFKNDFSFGYSTKGGMFGGGNSSGSRQMNRTRARIMRTSAAPFRGGGGRSSGAGVIMGGSAGGGSSSGSSRPMVPAPYVPEELVSQAQVVLQGKSRNLIIRELQVSFFFYKNKKAKICTDFLYLNLCRAHEINFCLNMSFLVLDNMSLL